MSRNDYWDVRHGRFLDLWEDDVQNWKRILALGNAVDACEHRHVLFLREMHEAFRLGFLSSEEKGYLKFLLHKYGINYLSWCYKTPWLKKRMATIKKARARKRTERVAERTIQARTQSQLEFPFVDINKTKTPPPVLAKVQQLRQIEKQRARRANR